MDFFQGNRGLQVGGWTPTGLTDIFVELENAMGKQKHGYNVGVWSRSLFKWSEIRITPYKWPKING